MLCVFFLPQKKYIYIYLDSLPEIDLFSVLTTTTSMPASAYSDGGELTHHNSLEDQRALQVALELSLLSFNDHGGAASPTSAAAQYTMDQIASLHYADEMRFLAKKSQNMTECVPVPSSEHVAEIVGRQGIYQFKHLLKLLKINFNI